MFHTIRGAMIQLFIWGVFLVSVTIIVYVMVTAKQSQSHGVTASQSLENFANLAGVSLQQMSTEALDRAPSTSEVKDDYKLLLLFSNQAIREGGEAAVKALRVLADLRDRLFDVHDFRESLVVDDFIGNWPDWLPPLDPTLTTDKSTEYTCVEAAAAEAHILAYLQKNYPQEANVDEQTGSTIRNIIEDFGYRFVFTKWEETVELSQSFLLKPLLRGWVSPCQSV